MSLATNSLRFVSRENQEALPPPNLTRGPIAWARENLFSGLFNTILTLLSVILLWFVVPPMLEFLFIDAVWTGADGPPAVRTWQGAPSGLAGPSCGTS